MAEKQKKQQVILKRQVLTKAVVTPKFKSFLNNELKQNIVQFKQKIAEMDAQLAGLNPADPNAAQIQQERNEAQAYIDSEKDQEKFIEDLELKSLYSQGPVDGFVTVSVGDNLYGKLGGAEIIVEDGIVKKITMNPSQFEKVTS